MRPRAAHYPGTVPAMIEHLRRRLGDGFDERALADKAELAVEINRLKRAKKAVILGHNYMEPALFHSVPDFGGDSLQLARLAAESEAEVIVFCGVRFMAETAKILNPGRLVLLPSAKGGCSLAASIAVEDVRRLKQQWPAAPVVSYVNTYADVKAESDYCCTSSNGAAVVQHLLDEGHREVIFLPDEYLATNVARELGVPIVFAPAGEAEGPGSADSPKIVGWRGRCEVHEQFTVDDVEQVRAQYPDAVVLAHPECSADVVQAADFSGSTSAMISHVKGLQGGRVLLLTECSMGDNIVARSPDTEILRLCRLRCPHMGEITLEQTLGALVHERHAIDVPEPTRTAARRALERMIAIG